MSAVRYSAYRYFFHVQTTKTGVTQCHVQFERPCSKHIQLCEFLGFRSGPVEVSIFFFWDLPQRYVVIGTPAVSKQRGGPCFKG